MRRLEQKTQALKERAWQLKARVQMLKEQMLGGGVGAQAVIAHANEMGSSFRLIKLIYTLDGTQVFVRTDDTAENLYKTKSFDVFAGPISPGNHNLAVVATYRGHGYGVFEYLSKYTFTAKRQPGVHRRRGQDREGRLQGLREGRPDDAAREARRDRLQGHPGRSPRSRRARAPGGDAGGPSTLRRGATTPAPAPRRRPRRGSEPCATSRSAQLARSSRRSLALAARPAARRRLTSTKLAAYEIEARQLGADLPRPNQLSERGRAAPAASTPRSRSRSATTTPRR